MSRSNPSSQSAILASKLADSLAGALPTSTPRQIFGATNLPGKATAVVGMRRAGKTTFLHQIRRERLARGLPRDAVPYLNFEDERLDALVAEDLTTVVEEFYRRQPGLRRDARVLWCFDEIQLVRNWERFVRRMLDEENVEVMITGSSAALLSREIATSLRGRAWEVIIPPFSFAEALRHQGVQPPDHPDFLTPSQRSHLERAFLDWLTTGGFPEAQGLDAASRHQLLRDYVDVSMLRDVVERHAVSNVAGLRWLVRHLLGNPAAMFSAQKFFHALKTQGLAISKDTVHQLLSHLEDCFLIRTVWMESASERQRMVNPRKAYPIDPGLIPVFDRSGRSNLGHALETAVLVELERRRHAVTYVRTPGGFEVDFLARSARGDSELIQVASDPHDSSTLERELRALTDAGQMFPHARRRLLTMTAPTTRIEAPDGITVQPAYEWCLSGPP